VPTRSVSSKAGYYEYTFATNYYHHHQQLRPDIGMLVSSGRAVTTFDPDTGVFTVVSVRGHAEDVCVTLAA
jgi:hypothetical protein